MSSSRVRCWTTGCSTSKGAKTKTLCELVMKRIMNDFKDIDFGSRICESILKKGVIHFGRG